MESSLDANNSEGQFKVNRGHLRSNGLPLLYGHKTWWMESSLDANHFLKVSSRSNGLLHEHETWWMESSLNANNFLKVSARSPGVTQGQMAYHCCMNMKVGRWSHIWMLTIMKVSSRSPEVIQRQMAYHYCMDMKLGDGVIGCQNAIW